MSGHVWVLKMPPMPKNSAVAPDVDALKMAEMARHHQGQVPKKQLHHHKT
jgi:hypothetical protein